MLKSHMAEVHFCVQVIYMFDVCCMFVSNLSVAVFKESSEITVFSGSHEHLQA
jgi:hypothetical protein